MSLCHRRLRKPVITSSSRSNVHVLHCLLYCETLSLLAVDEESRTCFTSGLVVRSISNWYVMRLCESHCHIALTSRTR